MGGASGVGKSCVARWAFGEALRDPEVQNACSTNVRGDRRKQIETERQTEGGSRGQKKTGGRTRQEENQMEIGGNRRGQKQIGGHGKRQEEI